MVQIRRLKQEATLTLGHEFADFTVVSEKNAYALPEGLSLEEGALVEPTAVAVQAVKEGGLQSGKMVAVFGATHVINSGKMESFRSRKRN